MNRCLKLIEAPTHIPVPGNKIIDEYIGRVNSGDTQASIAHMRSPAGWSEPGQRPEFDEYTVVLKGAMRVEHEGGVTEVKAGQAIIARKGEWVRYSTPEGAEYMAICVPAFSPEPSTATLESLLLLVNLGAAVIHAVNRALSGHGEDLAAAGNFHGYGFGHLALHLAGALHSIGVHTFQRHRIELRALDRAHPCYRISP